ncbi:hypothetical protein M5J15_15555 [Serratia symbiotica]|uniref:hypothetical protein n=1 Tax=Serratia symbiotica TaxID=138074 RepID=UPI002090A0C7|nr:hypothetical protein [Serratia symbiotica]USS95664.1 hypothetical protein M5J15_15555 [Serratia symbiotica]
MAQPGVAWDLAVLADRLPPHMVPVALVEMDELPLSANGQLDRKALPQPQNSDRKIGRELQAGLEADIAVVFARLLQREQVFADDDFFVSGGHSLLAMRWACCCSERWGRLCCQRSAPAALAPWLAVFCWPSP